MGGDGGNQNVSEPVMSDESACRDPQLTELQGGG